MCSLCCKEVRKLSHHHLRWINIKYSFMFFFLICDLNLYQQGNKESFISSYKDESHRSSILFLKHHHNFSQFVSFVLTHFFLVRGLMANASCRQSWCREFVEGVHQHFDGLICLVWDSWEQTQQCCASLQPASPSMFFWWHSTFQQIIALWNLGCDP